MPSLNNDVAAKYMKAAKLEPVVPYPRNGKLPWKSAKSRMVNEAEAIALMKRAGANPTSPYPGADKPWSSICVKCNKKISPQ